MKSSLNRKVLVAFLSFFLAISVGYAIFSETITIEGTATAQMQENLDIEASCITNVTTDLLTSIGLWEVNPNAKTEKGYNNVSCSIEGNTVKYSVGFDYPDAQKYYIIKMKNVGQITAYYETNTSKSIFNEEYSAKNTVKKYDANNNLLETITTTDGYGDYVDLAFIKYSGAMMVEDTDGNLFKMGADGFWDFVINDSQIKLEPGQSVYFLMESRWPNETIYSENNIKYVASNAIELDWNQVVE